MKMSKTHTPAKPDGDCFKANGMKFLALPDNAGAKLVHGLVTGNAEMQGVRFYHCWIELPGDAVLDVSNGFVALVSKGLYYKAGSITESETIKYNKMDALENMLAYEHWGYWESIPHECNQDLDVLALIDGSIVLNNRYNEKIFDVYIKERKHICSICGIAYVDRNELLTKLQKK